ncbi:MFS transporter [Nocardioides anomalus]|uniref:MFS transporter n=1 Tax=Nocardioides anomalus TaxID=2712223 RepID=UPI0018AD3002|nr:MFS transporter [Nocardioides anomalus]
MTGRGAALATLRERNFRWYFVSRLVNGVGGTMGSIALVFAVLEVSSSASALGVVLAAHSIPMVLFLLVGGVIADRFGRTLVIQTCNVLSGLTQLAIGFLVLTGTAELWQLVALTAVNGVVSAASLPALAGVLPQLVPREQLQPANVLISMQRGVLNVGGPALGGVLVVTIGAGWAVAIDGVTYLLSAAVLLLVRLPPPAPRDEQSSVLVDLREGWGYFRRTTWLWVVVLAFSALNAFYVGGFETLGPVLAKATSIGEVGWGLTLSAGAVGLLVTTVVMLRVRLERPLLWGMVGCTGFGAPMLALGIHPHLALVLVAAVVGGAGIELFSLGWNLALQEHVPEDMLSRAISYDMLGSMVAVPVGQLLVGPLGVVFGVQHTILVCALLFVAISLATLGSRAVRDLQRVPAEVS